MHGIYSCVKEVKAAVEQATKTLRGGRGTALLFL